MQQITHFIWNLVTWQDTGGHSFVDYALMALFVAVSVWTTMPGGLGSRLMRPARRPEII